MSTAARGPVSPGVDDLFRPGAESEGNAGGTGAETQTEGADEAAGTTQTAEEPEAGEESTADATGEEGGEAGEGEEDVDALIEQFAKEMGLDLNDQNQRKIAKRLADKESFIRRQKSELASLKKGGEREPDYMAEFDKSLKEPETRAEGSEGKDRTAADAKPTETPAEDQPRRFGDIGDGWTKPEDAYTQLNEAYANGDFRTVHQVDTALFVRRAHAILIPEIVSMLEKRLERMKETDLGDFRKVAEERSHEDARDYAIGKIREIPKFSKSIDALFEVQEGDDIEFEGQKYDNTPFNQIIAKFPNLRFIQVADKDPSKALKKTYFAKFLEAAKIHDQLLQGGNIKAGQVKALLDDAAKNAKQRDAQTRVRQGLNAGSGATGLGSSKTAKNYVDELNSLPGETPTRSLF
ncbi:MAG TPA: hypothetical protein VM492_07785 [Sumerlaeia bacterium]|nr:hypothetical protein [Sumerlaeia bacterium]